MSKILLKLFIDDPFFSFAHVQHNNQELYFLALSKELQSNLPPVSETYPVANNNAYDSVQLQFTQTEFQVQFLKHNTKKKVTSTHATGFKSITKSLDSLLTKRIEIYKLVSSPFSLLEPKDIVNALYKHTSSENAACYHLVLGVPVARRLKNYLTHSYSSLVDVTHLTPCTPT